MLSVLVGITSAYSIPIAALIISVATLVYSGLSIRQKSEVDQEGLLYERIDDLEGRLAVAETHTESCEKRCAALERKMKDLKDENFSLMRRVLRMENDGA